VIEKQMIIDKNKLIKIENRQQLTAGKPNCGDTPAYKGSRMF